VSTTDEILANPIQALGIPDGCIPIHVVLLVEYARPGMDTHPQRNGLALTTDDDCPPWTSIGMLDFAKQLEHDAVGNTNMGDDG
jgi:hypothetical protein